VTFSREIKLWSAVVVAELALAAWLGTFADAAETVRATVTINAARQYQRIAGFGVSEGFGRAKLLMSAPAPVRQQVLRLLYSPTRGAGLTMLRDEVSADAGPRPRRSLGRRGLVEAVLVQRC
jgi:O-glycosyl hydrolase